MDDLRVALASHELRNALTTVRGCALQMQRLLDTQGDLPLNQAEREALAQKQHAYLETILRRTQAMDDLLTRMLDPSRPDPAPPFPERRQPLDLVVVLQRVVNRHLQVQDAHSFMVQLPPDEMLVMGDESQLEQVLDHLLNHALTSSAPGTMITAGLSVQQEASQPPEAFIWIRDQGEGMSQKLQEYVLEPCTHDRAMNARHPGGWGVDLCACQQMVRLHGGRLWYKSTPREGGTFYVALPLLQSQQYPEEELHTTNNAPEEDVPSAEAALPTTHVASREGARL